MSCFMVSDEICMITKSCRRENAPTLEWKGKPDGTYSIEVLQDSLLQTSGTKVILFAKNGMEEYFTKEKIESLLTYYGLLLPFPIVIKKKKKRNKLIPRIFLGKGVPQINKNYYYLDK